VAVIAPGAGWRSKQWPVERFALLAAELEAMRLQVVVTGSEGERQTCETVAARVRNATVLAGAPLLTVAALLAHARLVVCNDSGLGHLAAAAGTPTVVLFNSTNPGFCGPLGSRARVLRSGCANQPYATQHHCHDEPNRDCPATCWDDLTTARVLSACSRLLIR
jgi:ADP-heptose:LPS heptosyltransferase